ncbi:MAG: OmpA family protein [Saprospiraceae bacterium]
MNKEKDEDLYRSEWKNGSWKNAEKVKDFNTDAPEGMSTLVRNGRNMYFTACMRDSVYGPCDIWQALVEGATIQDVSSLEGDINSVYWESQAAINCDGTKLFFASNRPGGVGGTDLYVSELNPNGTWSQPQNLGIPINTTEDEEAPFISNDGQTLYFSSTGHLGMGEQDIFMSWWDIRQQKWSVPINVGPPVNGPHRELGFFLSADGKTGFFSSNRPGGQGGMDIYQFQLSEQLFGEPITFLEGTVKDSVLLTGIPHATVFINGKKPVVADEQGRFFVCAGADETLDLSLEVTEYHPYHNQFFIPHWENKEFYNIDVLLQPELSFLAEIEKETLAKNKRENPKELMVRHSLLFGFDSANINEQEIEGLEALVQSLSSLRVIKVEIIGYADDIGSSVYNLQLSEDRAKNVAIFLLNRSVPVDDIHIKGKGSLVNDKEKSMNRRVDIQVTVLE